MSKNKVKMNIPLLDSLSDDDDKDTEEDIFDMTVDKDRTSTFKFPKYSTLFL